MYIYNLKKFKLLAFWRKLTPFIGQKCTYEKVPKNWAGPPPLFGQNPKEQQFFLRIPSLGTKSHFFQTWLLILQKGHKQILCLHNHPLQFPSSKVQPSAPTQTGRSRRDTRPNRRKPTNDVGYGLRGSTTSTTTTPTSNLCMIQGSFKTAHTDQILFSLEFPIDVAFFYQSDLHQPEFLLTGQKETLAVNNL